MENIDDIPNQLIYGCMTFSYYVFNSISIALDIGGKIADNIMIELSIVTDYSSVYNVSDDIINTFGIKTAIDDSVDDPVRGPPFRGGPNGYQEYLIPDPRR